MLLRPPDAISLHYGRGSAALHRAQAADRGVPAVVIEMPEIALDLDTPADLRLLLGTEKGRTSAAGRLLRSWGFSGEGERSSS